MYICNKLLFLQQPDP